MIKIILKRGREESLRRFHPWVFSGAIADVQGNPAEGDLVSVHASDGECLAYGHFQGLKHNEPRVSLRKLVAAILQVIFVALITIGIVYFVCQYKTEKPFIDIIIVGATSSILMCLLGFFVALNKEQRQKALEIIRSKIKR